MHCDDALPLLSAALDEPLTPAEAAALAEHVAGCPDCQAFQAHLEALRRELRYETVTDVPDVAPAVLEAITRPRRPAWPQAAAAFAAGLFAGAVFVGLGIGQPSHIAVADLPARVLAAQSAVETLAADVRVVERGWHDDVPERIYTGTLAYRAPESLALSLRDETDYPAPDWQPNHIQAVTDGDTVWTSGPAPCPRELLPGCTPPEPRTRTLLGREPFDASAPAPLDLVVPVASFNQAGQPEVLGTTRLDDRPAVGVAVTAAQVAPLLDGLRQAGHWREVHPADRVELWLDADALVPLAVDVLPADDAERDLWAARRGYADPAGTAILELRLGGVRLNEPVAAFPRPPADGVVKRPGFREQPVDIAPAWLPDGLRYHRSGVVANGGPRVEVAAYSDGRAWVIVRRTADWQGEGLFGDLGEAVRPVSLDDAGVAYVNPGGTRIALRGEDVDVVVAGSVGEEGLVRIASGLGVTGQPLPAAEVALAGLLVPADPDGFAAPGARRSDDTVTLVYVGPGERWFSLTQGPGDVLSPPLEPDVRGVQVRGTIGRYTPSLGELEWHEAPGETVSIRSDTLTLAELVALAEQLERR
jgi:hypothetical protein